MSVASLPRHRRAWSLWQARKEELLQTVQALERLMEQEKAEHGQLRAERDMLADCVCSLQESQLQPPAPTDIRAQVRGSVGGALRFLSVHAPASGDPQQALRLRWTSSPRSLDIQGSQWDVQRVVL